MVVCLAGLIQTASALAQESAPNPASLTIQAAGKAPLVLTAEEFHKLPQTVVMLRENDEEMKYAGVSLHQLLEKAGAPVGNLLHGRALSSYVLASARDGYAAVFTLTESDPSFTDDAVLVADQVNGAALPEKQGPFRLIVPHDKKPARAVRMLEKIEVVQLRP